MRIKIPAARLQEELPQAFDNKVVLSFKGNYFVNQAQSWIETFNVTSGIKLLYIESLGNALYVAEVVETPLGGGRAELLTKTCGKVGGHFATFNIYHTIFDLLNPSIFYNLISVLIQNAIVAMVTFLKEVLAPFGVVVDSDFEHGLQHLKIFALVVTSRRTFERDALVEFEAGKTAHFAFEFFRPFVRCFGCFAVKHATRDC